MAQTLYYNGTILTMEDRCPQVEAVLTEDGRILETGTWEKVKERAGDKARRLDLQGRVMMPGLIESHSHFTACALFFPTPFCRPAPATQWKWTWAGRAVLRT